MKKCNWKDSDYCKLFNITYWDEYEISHNNKGKSAKTINKKIDFMYTSRPFDFMLEVDNVGNVIK